MLTFDIALDPNEIKDYAFDWSSAFEPGEAIASQVVTFIAEAGTTNPQNTNSSAVSRVFLTGGNTGERAIFTIRITTSAGRVLEEAFAVKILESTYETPAETEADRLTREIAEAKAQRAKVGRGDSVEEVWRDGRRIVRQLPTLNELQMLIRQLEGELYAAQAAAGIETAPRRTAIGVCY